MPLIAAEIIEDMYKDALNRPKWDGKATKSEFMDNLDTENTVNQLQEVINPPQDTAEQIYTVNDKLFNIFQWALGGTLNQNSKQMERKRKFFSQ